MRALWTASFLVAGIALVSASGAQQAGRGASAAADLDAFFRRQVDDFGLAGIGACIVKDDRIAWRGGFGWADIERRRPVTAETIFGAGSVSKTLTLAAFMRLWEDGRCGLDDDVNAYVSFPVRNPRFPDKPITLRMLLSFTAGIFDVDFQAGRNRLDVFFETRDPAGTAEAALREFLTPEGKYYADENFMESEPGAAYAYSNAGYALIGCVVERLGGRPFWAYCRDEIFAPLGMKDSHWRLADLDRDRYAYPYTRGSGGPTKEEPSTWPGYMDGGLQTTTGDIGRFLVMLMNRGRFEGRTILRPETVDAMLALQDAPGAPPGRGFPTIGRSFAWILSRVQDRALYQMNGFGPAFFAQVYFDPERRTGGAFFTTGGFASFQALGNAVQLFFDGLLAATDGL